MVTKSKKSASKSAKKPAAKKAAPVAEQQNGVHRPAAGTLCAKVWEALDRLQKSGKALTFDAVREAAGDGMSDATIRTQRQLWRTFNGIQRDAKPAKARKSKSAEAVETQPAA